MRISQNKGAKDTIFPLAEAREMFEIGKKAYTALGAGDKIAHVIGAEGHRFYADQAWAELNKIRK